MGQVAALPRAAALERLGFPGLRAWLLARGERRPPPRPRRPPRPLRAAFPSPSRWRHCRRSRPRRGCCWASWPRRPAGAAAPCAGSRCGPAWPTAAPGRAMLTLREATADPERLALAALPRLAEVDRPGGRALDRRAPTPRGRSAGTSSRPSPRGPRSAGGGPARRCARCGPPRGTRRCCGPWRSSPGRASPSADGRSFPTSREVSEMLSGSRSRPHRRAFSETASVLPLTERLFRPLRRTSAHRCSRRALSRDSGTLVG